MHAAAVSTPARTISGVRVRGFRSIVDLTVELGPLCALVGAAQSGKSNLLAALGVEQVDVDLDTKRVTVSGAVLEEARLRAAIEGAGYEAEEVAA